MVRDKGREKVSERSAVMLWKLTGEGRGMVRWRLEVRGGGE